MSVAALPLRAGTIGAMQHPESLPITEHLAEIGALVAAHPVVLLSSPPGTGKTTVLPPYLLTSYLAADGGKSRRRIALLEPRRIAAVRTAEYIASEQLATKERVGQSVGYRVRGDTKVSAETRLEVQTYGVFNRIAASSLDLPEYDLVIFDEAHERSIDIDLALAQALEIQGSIRPDLKIVVMSATLNVDDLRTLVPNAPLVSVSAVTYPVEVSYLPPRQSEERRLEAHVARAVQSVDHRPGDILVFLPGAAEIARVTEELTARAVTREVVPLFGDLSLKEQRAVLNPSEEDGPRVIVASSIAETSLTVPRVHTVIDSGLSRVPRFDAERGLPGLATVRVSSATAEQRAGRAGRLGPGLCLRLWESHEALVRFRSPEITESDLAPLVLTLASAGVRDCRSMRWLTPPSAGAIKGAQDLLQELGALESDGRITEHGQQMQYLPVHPRLAHLVLTAQRYGQAELGCDLAALWSEMKPSAHGQIVDLNALSIASGPSSAKELSKQLLSLLKGSNDKGGSKTASRTVSPATLFAAAFPDRIGHHRGEREFLLSGGPRAVLPEGSPLVREEWLICPAIRSRAGSATATISAASAVSEHDLRAAFPQLFSKRSVEVFHSARKAVVQRVSEFLGAIEVSAIETPSQSAEATAVLLSHISFLELPCASRTTTFIERSKWLDQIGAFTPDTGRWWEKLGQPGLPWLLEFVPGVTRLSEISEEALHHAVEALAGGRSVSERVARLAPTTITLPRGRTVTLRYTEQRAPVAASRLQDFFGITIHPTVANGTVAIICELLSPAGRPVQVTDDLPRFWKGSYAAVRKDLKSRYPKHDWPEKP